MKGFLVVAQWTEVFNKGLKEPKYCEIRSVILGRCVSSRSGCTTVEMQRAWGVDV
jgi:hypothetical protein